MRFSWPVDTPFTQHVLTVEQPTCPVCQRHLHVCDHRFHRIHTLQGPLEIVCKLTQCPDQACPDHHKTHSPLAEAQITLPWWTIGWDVFCFLGHRRFAQHWSIPQLQGELKASYHIRLSDDAIAGYLKRYRLMVAARQHDPGQLALAYRAVDSLVLSIDGLQPEKGHETLYVVRELNAKRVWFAQPLLSSAAAEVRQLIAKAKDWAQQLGKQTRLWLSDKQDAFVTGIAQEFPDVDHRFCQNHFLRDVAKPVLEADSHAKVQMRQKVRGLRDIERQVLDDRRQARDQAAPAPSAPPPTAPAPLGDRSGTATSVSAAVAAASVPVAATSAASAPAGSPAAPAVAVAPQTAAADEAGQVVLDYCSCVRGILNDDQGGPLHPPGLRMAEGLRQVRQSLQRNLEAKKGGALRGN